MEPKSIPKLVEMLLSSSSCLRWNLGTMVSNLILSFCHLPSVLYLVEQCFSFDIFQHHVSKDGISFTSSTGLVIVDCVPGVGNFFEAFAQVVQKVNVPVFYCPLFGSMEHRDWFDQFWTSDLCQQFQEGKLAVPGCDRLPNNCSEKSHALHSSYCL